MFELLICEKSEQYNVDKNLIKAIIKVESAFNPLAIRYEPNFLYFVDVEKFAKKNNISIATEGILQKCSYGLMQLMGATARSLGFEDTLIKLFDPNLNLDWGLSFLSKLLKKYDSIEDVIASYNAGVARRREGRYVNQSYVDKVMKAYNGFCSTKNNS
jgi:soluble lytic murein transglycosylase-like protein